MTTPPPQDMPEPPGQQPPPGQAPPPGSYSGGQAPPPGAFPPGGYPQSPGTPMGTQGAQPPLSPSDERMWSLLSHLSGILFSFLGPLVIWLVFRERSTFVDNQGKEALNFQITLLIGYFVSSVLMVVLIGFLMIFAVIIAHLVLCIIAGLAAQRGESYRYPLTLRLIK